MQNRNQAAWVERAYGICGIYTITYTPTGSVYVGSSISCGQRWAGHIINLNRKRHNKLMQPLWDSSTPEDWSFAVVKTLPNMSADDILLQEEKSEWDRQQACGVVMLCERPKGRGNARKPGVKEKMSAAKKGKTFGPPSEEAKANMSAAQKGKPKSDEHKANISAAMTGKKLGPRSDEIKAKIAATSKGKTLSDETKAKMSAAKTGKPKSDETRAKMSAIHKARWEKKRSAFPPTIDTSGIVVDPGPV
jgi:hypothetical protein